MCGCRLTTHVVSVNSWSLRIPGFKTHATSRLRQDSCGLDQQLELGRQVDLGGACAPGSWFRPLSDCLGWTDAFVDRILMSIQLVRDEVEHRGFVSTPFAVTGAPQARKVSAARTTNSNGIQATKQVAPDNTFERVTGHQNSRCVSLVLCDCLMPER